MKNIGLVQAAVHVLLASVAALPVAAHAQNVPGNVTVTVTNGDLIIRGDAGDNNIILMESGIAGRAGTKVNGERRIFIPDGVTNDVRIDMVGGDDFVRIELPGTNFAIPNNLVVTTGLGDDYLELLQVRAPNATRIDTGDGNDIVFVDGVQSFSDFVRPDFGGRFVLRTGPGEDLFEFHNATFRGEVDVRLGGGIDGACSTEDSEFLAPQLANFDGGGPSDFPGDGFVAHIISLPNPTNFEFFPDDCSFLGGRF
jgi:hypothetical protein